MVTADMKLKDTCSLKKKKKKKKTLAPWKKTYDQPSQRIKNRDITLPTGLCLVKAMVFPVVTYGHESLTIKKAER